MALWVLHEHSFGFAAEAIEKAVARDRFIRRIRAKNLLDRFLGESSYVELAHSLLETNLRLAAQIGGIAFEQMVRRRHPHGAAWKEKDLGDLIYELQKRVDPLSHQQWKKARLIRNKAIHGKAVTRSEVETLLRALDVGRSG